MLTDSNIAFTVVGILSGGKTINFARISKKKSFAPVLDIAGFFLFV